MTVPKLMDGWSTEETTQEQYDWLYDMSMELRNLEQVISPLLSRAWSIMSELQEVVDESQEWTTELGLNSLDTGILHIYAHGTIDILREVKRKFGFWEPEGDEND